MKTPVAKLSDINRHWHLIDLEGQVLGRAVTKIAQILMGKHVVKRSANLDQGDYVIAINADKIVVTGNKLADKTYYRHSGFPGGFRSDTLGEKMTKDSRWVIENAVKGMLPKNKLQSPRLRRLKVFKTAEHTYADKLPK